MKLSVVEGNTQRLDGGAMFGNAPRELWKKWVTVDHLNRIPLATRSLLWELDDGRKVLFEVGMGAFFEPKLRERYGQMQDDHVLLQNLEELGCPHDQIDILILSHLHFDHVGGLLTPWEEGEPQLLFPRAQIYVGKRQWEHALQPHPRDQASYIPAIQKLLEGCGRLHLVEESSHPHLDFGLSFLFFEGHTPGLMVSRLELPHGPLYYISDLCPGLPWVHTPISMGYDRFPEGTVQEKQALWKKVLQEEGKLFFVHDPQVPCVGLQQDERGRVSGFSFDLHQLYR